MSKMNYRRRGKTPARWIPEGFMTKAKRMHRRAVRRAGKVEMSISMTIDGDYVPELKVRDCARISRTPARVLAAWEYV